jgi:A118 family predicted phage portal protein
MFQRILQWIREQLNKMLNQTNVKQALNVDVAISAPMATALQTWSLMYTNQATWLNNDIKSLNLPAAIAGEIARAVTIEMTVEVSGSPRADYLNDQFENVVNVLRQYVEYGVAKGGLMMKPYVSGDNISVDFVQADQFFPVAFDANGNITSCIFSDQRQVGTNYFTRLEYHQTIPEGCIIRNQAYKSQTKDTLGQQVQLTELDAWKDLEPEATITGIDKPLFAYFKFPQANNIDPTSPLGVSCFARAASGTKCLIQQADEQWSNLLWEFESGQRALYVDVLAFGKTSDGKPILPNKRLYRTMESGSAEGEFFQEWSPTLRELNILNGLDAILRKIEFTCGLAYGMLSNPATVYKTATELKISQQRSYSTITDCQKNLEEALEQLLWAMDTWATIDNLAPAGTYEAVYEWDDSVIVDKDLQFQQDMRLVTAGLMSKIEFRVRNFGESEELATKMLAMIPVPEPVGLFGGAQ